MNQKINDEELLDDLQRVADELGESPTVAQYRENGEYSAHTLQNRFGSWNKAKEEIGLETTTGNKPNKISDEQLLQDIERVAEEVTESPTQKEYRQHGEYSLQTVINRFGSWNKAKQEVGISTNDAVEEKASVEDIIQDLKDGKTLREIRDKYGYSHTAAPSERVKEAGYRVRSRLSKNEANYSGDRWAGMMNIPASTLDELGINSVEDAYYDMETFQEDGEKRVKITFRSERVKEVEDEDGGENP